jgi:hypothetical protein
LTPREVFTLITQRQKEINATRNGQTWIQWRYADVSPLSVAAKVMAGGALVLGAGVLIGSS